MAWLSYLMPSRRTVVAADAPLANAATRGQTLTEELFIALDNIADLLPSVAQKLADDNGVDADELQKALVDPEISAHLESRRNAVLAMPWRLEGDEQIIEWLHPILSTQIRSATSVLWQCVLNGYSVAHVTYRQADERWQWDQIMDRPTTTFRPIKTGELRYFPEDGSGGSEGLEIDPFDLRYKLFYAVANRSTLTPQGDGLLPRLYWLYLFRRHGWRFWGRYLERMAGGIIVGKTPAFDRQREAFASALNALVQSSNITISPEESVDIVTTSGNGEAYRAFIDAVNREIQKMILGRTLSGDQTAGSRAALNEDDDVRDDRALSDMLLILPTLQKMVDGLVHLNAPNAAPPQLIIGETTSLYRDLADRDKVLFEAGARFSPAYFVKAYDLEPGDIEERATRVAQNPTDITLTLADGHTPNDGMKREAQRGLDWRTEFGRGGTAVGIARARDIVNGKALSADTVRRMRSFFARHAVDKDADGFRPGEDGYPSNGRIAWALWGGDAGDRWAKATKLPDEIEASGGHDCCNCIATTMALADDAESDEPDNALTAGILAQWSERLATESDGEIQTWALSIEEVLNQAKDMKSAAKLIIENYSKMPPDDFAQLIQKAMIVARLAGEYDVQREAEAGESDD